MFRRLERKLWKTLAVMAIVALPTAAVLDVTTGIADAHTMNASITCTTFTGQAQHFPPNSTVNSTLILTVNGVVTQLPKTFQTDANGNATVSVGISSYTSKLFRNSDVVTGQMQWPATAHDGSGMSDLAQHTGACAEQPKPPPVEHHVPQGTAQAVVVCTADFRLKATPSVTNTGKDDFVIDGTSLPGVTFSPTKIGGQDHPELPKTATGTSVFFPGTTNLTGQTFTVRISDEGQHKVLTGAFTPAVIPSCHPAVPPVRKSIHASGAGAGVCSTITGLQSLTVNLTNDGQVPVELFASSLPGGSLGSPVIPAGRSFSTTLTNIPGTAKLSSFTFTVKELNGSRKFSPAKPVAISPALSGTCVKAVTPPPMQPAGTIPPQVAFNNPPPAAPTMQSLPFTGADGITFKLLGHRIHLSTFQLAAFAFLLVLIGGTAAMTCRYNRRARFATRRTDEHWFGKR